MSPDESLELARKHLSRVQESWDPPEWLDLASYGLYAIEAAVVAAALHRGGSPKRTHWDKAATARDMATKEGLPEISDLMSELNEARKSRAYGDIAFPAHLDAGDVARQVEEYVEAVAKYMET
jgi:hypothetical protein